MDPLSDQLQAPDAEEEAEAGQNCNFYHQNFDYNSKVANLSDFASSAAIPTQRKIQSDQNLNSPLPRITKAAKRRKAADVFEVQYGGRIVRSSSSKDRHSKVCTNRGPKDRRVRLSPTTAIQFYDVQDRLGYDRPSKAIDWLMKEAKTAIDALNEQSTFAQQIAKHGIGDSGMLIHQKQCQHLDIINAGNHNPISGFASVFDNTPPPNLAFTDGFNSSRTRIGGENSLLYPDYQQGLVSTITNSQIVDTNMEMTKLQRIFNWNNENVNSGQPILSHSQIMFSQREPLQSSFVSNYYSPIGINEYPGINFYSDEFSNFTAAAALEESENGKITVFSKNSTAHFLHKED